MLGRRGALGGASSGVLLLCTGKDPVARAEASPPLSSAPSGGELALKSGHVRACRGGNPNCVSTFSRGEDTRVPPWRYDGSLGDASEALVQLVPAEWEGAELVESKRLPDGSYLAFQGPGPFGMDDLEVILRPGQGGGDGEADGTTGVASFRCEARDTVFLYPIQTPVSALGAQRKRMERLRERLGWTSFA